MIFMGTDYVIQPVGRGISNAAWGLRVIGVRCRRMGGPGVTVDTRCEGPVRRRIGCYSPGARPFCRIGVSCTSHDGN